MGHEFMAPTRPSLCPRSSIRAASSGRVGMYWAVRARPTTGTSSWIVFQSPSNWFG